MNGNSEAEADRRAGPQEAKNLTSATPTQPKNYFANIKIKSI